ncbi:MAG: UDP-N-acetylmuramoyl-tripeptide--D-alanyl-D-alanine ligase [Saprospiraceae bacterium]
MVSLENLYAVYQHHPIVCTDSRQVTPGCLFFALKGEKFDGNRFVQQVLADGAAYAVTDAPPAAADPDRCLRVPDTLEALQDLANYHRRQFDIPVIAIGGSNGKTTTKELVSAVLSSHYPCHSTKGNLNNHIGVPLTLLAMPAETEVAVIEVGANHAGDIEQLCAIAEPTHGLLTNIGKEHLEGFGSIGGVKKAEGELFEYLARQNGCAFVNASEKYLSKMSRAVNKKVVYAAAETLRAQDSLVDIQMISNQPFVHAAFLSESGQTVKLDTQLMGHHNFHNIMTAVALGVYFKVPASKIKSAIETYRPANNRSQVLTHGSNTIFLDAYNANPSSMRVALETLQSAKAGKKVALLGDMLELGAESEKEHRAILRFAASLQLDALVVVGQEFARCASSRYNALSFPDAGTAKAWYDLQRFEDAFILVKASRGIGLERVVAASP